MILELKIVQGMVQLRYAFGGKSDTIRCIEKSVNDNKWHEVKYVKVKKKNLLLIIKFV